eukprot:165280-Amphidinium_carterae.1
MLFLDTRCTSRSNAKGKNLRSASGTCCITMVPRNDQLFLQGSQNHVQAPRQSAWQRTVAMAGSRMDASTRPNS